MALWNIKNVKLAGVAGAVPDKVVDTHDFDFFNREEADVFIDTVGIEKRYVATDDICASDLCMAAAENLIAKLGWNKEEIDILSFASVPEITGLHRPPVFYRNVWVYLTVVLHWIFLWDVVVVYIRSQSSGICYRPVI